MLQEILGNQEEALESYKKYCSLSKKTGDKRCIAQAYGCLGSVYASLGNHAMSKSYLEQFIASAKKLGDVKLQLQAFEQYGDTSTKLKEYGNAIDSYSQMLKICTSSDLHSRTAATLKIGSSYKAQEKYQHALYYMEQAKMLSQDNDFKNIEIICKLNIASILQHSTQMFELDQAKNYLEELIPLLEAKIEHHREEDSFCSEELYGQLLESFDSMQNILIKLGNHKEALMYAEQSRCQRSAFDVNVNKCLFNISQNVSQGFFDGLINIVHQQNATVLYYSVLNDALFLWVLQPAIGIARFYAGKNITTEQTIPEQIKDLTNKIKQTKAIQKEDFENRSLPLKNIDIEFLRKQNEALSRSPKTEEDGYSAREATEKTIARQFSQVKSPQRKLFDILLAPVDDFLSKLEEHTPLVIICDKVLCSTPIWTAMDWDNKALDEYFRITMLPSLHHLGTISQNEINQLRIHDNLEFERSQSRFGGIPKLLSPREVSNELYPVPESTPDSILGKIDLKKTSNPRLMTSSLYGASLNPKREAASRESVGTAKSLPTSRIRERTRSTLAETPKKNIVFGSPTTMARMAGAHSLSTLTTRTSTTTDVTTSFDSVPEFQQISDPYKCVVFGNPTLPKWLVILFCLSDFLIYFLLY